MSDITQLLQAMGKGDQDAGEELLAIVYDELHRLALSKLSTESPGHTLQPTALVHEAYMRLVPANSGDAMRSDGREREPRRSDNSDSSSRQPAWHSRAHFFGAAAEAMRRVLIDSARKRRRIKRGGDRSRVDLSTAEIAVPQDSTDLLALDEALDRLEEVDPSKAQVVKLRYFAGLSLEETAAALDVSVPTVHRKWRFARAWLQREIEKE